MNQVKHIVVVQFHRKPIRSYHSIERLFSVIRSNMPSNISLMPVVSPFVSRGFWRRVLNIFRAAMLQGEVNHITGDVHYLTYLLRKKKTIVTMHDCVRLEYLKGIKKTLLLYLWYRIPERRAAIITAISQSTKQELLRYLRCSPEKIRVIHNCVSSSFRPNPKAFNAKKPKLLLVGTGENKNLLRVAEALQGTPSHLRIIGQLSEVQLSVLRKYGIDYSSVANISDVEIVREYEASDMLIFVSTYEGFGLPIIEANVVGRPVITSNLYSMPEIAGNAACLVDPLMVDEIRDGILRIIHDENYRTSLIEKGYINAERFKAPDIARQYARLYEELCSRNQKTDPYQAKG